MNDPTYAIIQSLWMADILAVTYKKIDIKAIWTALSVYYGVVP